MLTNDGNISANMTSEVESMSDDEKMFLYARAVHSNHSIQYHMHQIMELQRVVEEYRNMMMEGMDLIPLESNLHKFNSVIISQIINTIESDNFWHRKTIESVMSDLRNMWAEGIQELENAHLYCTNDKENNNEMDGVEVIDLCSVSQSKNDMFSDGKESARQEKSGQIKTQWNGQNGSQIKNYEEQVYNYKGKSPIHNDVLRAHKQFLRRRASRRTRECGEETC